MITISGLGCGCEFNLYFPNHKANVVQVLGGRAAQFKLKQGAGNLQYMKNLPSHMSNLEKDNIIKQEYNRKHKQNCKENVNIIKIQSDHWTEIGYLIINHSKAEI